MTVVAKFKVASVAETSSDHRNVTMAAVYSSDPAHENYSWSKWTPSGSINMSITNPEAFNQFEAGAEYMVTFKKVEKT